MTSIPTNDVGDCRSDRAGEDRCKTNTLDRTPTFFCAPHKKMGIYTDQLPCGCVEMTTTFERGHASDMMLHVCEQHKQQTSCCFGFWVYFFK